MLRTLWVVIVALAVTIPGGIGSLVLGLTVPRSGAIDAIIRWWARSILRAAGVQLRTENLERLDMTKRYIYIGNHTSYFDIPSLQAVLRQPIRFLAKKSLFSIPIFGWAIKATGFVPIDRKDRSTAARSFDLAASQIRSGKSVAVFPEEGRSRSREMRPFKRGAFLLALKSGVPIVPVAFRGMYDVMPATRLRVQPGEVTLVFGEPIDTAQFTVRQRDELAELTRARIQEMLLERVDG